MKLPRNGRLFYIINWLVGGISKMREIRKGLNKYVIFGR